MSSTLRERLFKSFQVFGFNCLLCKTEHKSYLPDFICIS